ncbi:hypothetical protein ACTWPT_18900 [Nonomuraea sp. 3N208]|uniref:hypothetical protein n=1 Tax=Nonomuraea sp. 3N208 TaxID=3457421 RepID=UPI003FCC42BD
MTWRRRASFGLPILMIAAGVLWLVQGSGDPDPVKLTGRGAHYTVRVALESEVGLTEARINVSPAPAEVSVFAVMPHMGHTSTEIAAQRDGDAGRYVARGELFTMSGVWQLGIRVRGGRGTEVITVNTLVGEGE